MATLHIEHPITDYATWRTAFDSFADARRAAGVRSEQIQQPVDDNQYVVVDLTFDTAEVAHQFRQFLQANVWSSATSAPGLAGTPHVVVLETLPVNSGPGPRGHVTFINLFEVPTGRDEAFLELWEVVNRYMSKKKGYLDHRLHRAHGDAVYRFVNVAHWATSQDYADAHDDGFRVLVRQPEWAEFKSTPALFDTIHEGSSGLFAW